MTFFFVRPAVNTGEKVHQKTWSNNASVRDTRRPPRGGLLVSLGQASVVSACRRADRRRGDGCFALFEPVTVTFHLEDVNMVGEAVEQCNRSSVRSELELTPALVDGVGEKRKKETPQCQETHPPYAGNTGAESSSWRVAGRSIDQLGARVRTLGQRDLQMSQGRRCSMKGCGGDGLDHDRARGNSRRPAARETGCWREEREILAKAAGLVRSGDRFDAVAAFRVRKGQPGYARHCYHVPRTGRLRQRLLRATHAATCGARARMPN